MNIDKSKDETGVSLQSGYHIEPVDRATFSTRRISEIQHNYEHHPLMQLEKLEQLAHFLAEKGQCRFVSPDIKLDSEFFHQSEHVDGKPLSQVFADMSNPRSWIALYNVEANPEYRQLLHSMIDELHPLIDKEQKGIFNIGGFIFISAPPSVTPFHIDRENNFWLQIRGQKKITVFDHMDRDVVAAKAVEDFIINRGLDDVRLACEITDRGKDFFTSPGKGVYFPATTPHMTSTTDEWVTPDDSISISLGVVFYSNFTRQQARVLQTNSILRKLGMTPRHPGVSAASDAIKQAAGLVVGILKTRLKGYDGPPGSY